MKTLLSFLFVLCMLTSNAQYSKHRREHSTSKFGTGMVIGGVAMLTISLTTAPTYDFVPANSTYNPNTIPSNTNGTYVVHPFMQQGGRTYGVFTGVAITFTGLITMLTGN